MLVLSEKEYLKIRVNSYMYVMTNIVVKYDKGISHVYNLDLVYYFLIIILWRNEPGINLN